MEKTSGSILVLCSFIILCHGLESLQVQEGQGMKLVCWYRSNLSDIDNRTNTRLEWYKNNDTLVMILGKNNASNYFTQTKEYAELVKINRTHSNHVNRTYYGYILELNHTSINDSGLYSCIYKRDLCKISNLELRNESKVMNEYFVNVTEVKKTRLSTTSTTSSSTKESFTTKQTSLSIKTSRDLKNTINKESNNDSKRKTSITRSKFITSIPKVNNTSNGIYIFFIILTFILIIIGIINIIIIVYYGPDYYKIMYYRVLMCFDHKNVYNIKKESFKNKMGFVSVAQDDDQGIEMKEINADKKS